MTGRETATAALDMRERLLAVATELFAQRGFHGTSLQAVANAVGIKKPSLLYHFPSKDALRQAVLDAMLEHWRRDIPAVMARERARDRLTGILAAMIDYFRGSPERARLLVREALDNPEGLKALFRKHLAPWTGLLTEQIRLGQQSGVVREEVQPEAFVLEVIVLVVGSAALSDLGDAIVPRASEPPGSYLTEVLRIASTSLYRPRTDRPPQD